MFKIVDFTEEIPYKRKQIKIKSRVFTLYIGFLVEPVGGAIIRIPRDYGAFQFGMYHFLVIPEGVWFDFL